METLSWKLFARVENQTKTIRTRFLALHPCLPYRMNFIAFVNKRISKTLIKLCLTWEQLGGSSTAPLIKARNLSDCQ